MTAGAGAPTTTTYDIRLVDRATGRLAPGCNFITGGVAFEFTRVLNEASGMSLVLNLAEPGCRVACECIPEARRHELVAFRSDRPTEAAWVGPVTNVLEEPDLGTITINAKDRMWWLTGAPASRAFGPGDFGPVDRNGEVSVVEVFGALLADAERYQRSGLRFPAALPSDRSGVRVQPPSIPVGDSLWFHMQGYLGSLVDFTVVGEQLYWGAPEVPVLDGINLSTGGNWQGGSGVSTDVDGSETFTKVRVTGATGIVAEYPPVDVDLGYGKRVGFISDTEITTQEEAAATAQFVFERNHEPATFLITGEGSLNESTGLAVADLIPGRKHQIRATTGCIRADARRRITAVVVSGLSAIRSGGFVIAEERVAVDFQPPGTEGRPTQVTA